MFDNQDVIKGGSTTDQDFSLKEATAAKILSDLYADAPKGMQSETPEANLKDTLIFAVHDLKYSLNTLASQEVLIQKKHQII